MRIDLGSAASSSNAAEALSAFTLAAADPELGTGEGEGNIEDTVSDHRREAAVRAFGPSPPSPSPPSLPPSPGAHSR